VRQVTVSRIPYGDTELISFASLAAQDHSEKPHEQRLRSPSQVRRKCQDIFDWSVQQKGAIGKNNLKLRECENELEVVKMKLAKYENRKIKDMGDVMNHYGQNKQTGSERVKKLIDLKQAEVEEFKNMIKNL